MPGVTVVIRVVGSQAPGHRQSVGVGLQRHREQSPAGTVSRHDESKPGGKAVFDPLPTVAAIVGAEYSPVILPPDPIGIGRVGGEIVDAPAGLIDAFKSGRDFHSITAARVFDVPADDVTPGSGGARGPVAVLSHGFWERRFGARPDAIGTPIVLNGQPFTIVGVAPRGFAGTEIGQAPDVFAPMTMQPVLLPRRSRRQCRPRSVRMGRRTGGRTAA